MQSTDLLFLNVIGTNHSIRNTRTITKSFDGLGREVNDKGEVINATPQLLNLPAAGGVTRQMPAFPVAEVLAAQAANDVPQVKALQIAYAEQVKAYEAETGAITPNAQIGRSVMSYLERVHDFRQVDSPDHFVLKPDDIDVTVVAMPDGRSLYTVSASAVFG